MNAPHSRYALADAFEFFDQAGGDTLAALVSAHDQVVDVDLLARLLELGQHIGRQPAHNFALQHCGQRDEGIAGQEFLQIHGIRLGIAIGGHLLEDEAKQVQQGAKIGDLLSLQVAGL